jgi:hypothetical protein
MSVVKNDKKVKRIDYVIEASDLEYLLAKELSTQLCSLGLSTISQGSSVYKRLLFVFKDKKLVSLKAVRKKQGFKLIVIKYDKFIFTEAYKQNIEIFASTLLGVKIISWLYKDY